MAVLGFFCYHSCCLQFQESQPSATNRQPLVRDPVRILCSFMLLHFIKHVAVARCIMEKHKYVVYSEQHETAVLILEGCERNTQQL